MDNILVNTYSLRAQYLGNTDNGVKMHSRYLAMCDVSTTLALFKEQSISIDNAPIFIDLWEDTESTLIETVGISEQTYFDVTGEQILSYSDYERESELHEDIIFGAMQKQLREQGIEVPVNEQSQKFDAALNLHKFRKSDHVIHEVPIDDVDFPPKKTTDNCD